MTTSCKQAIYVQAVLLDWVTLGATNLQLPCGARTQPNDTIIGGVTVAGTGFPRLPNGTAFNNAACHITSGYTDSRRPNFTNNGYIITRIWTIVNNCSGQMLMWSQSIEVRDAAPTLTLKTLTTAQITLARRVEVTANDFILTLTDDCTPRANMVLGIRKVGTGTGFPTASTLSFFCGEQGNYNVEVWVRDNKDNITTQIAPLSIKDDSGNCSIPVASGMIRKEDGTEVPAKIMLYSNLNIPLDSTEGTAYQFNILLPNTQNRVMPMRPNTDWTNGVTMYDVVLMNRHILGSEMLSTPYRIIAADVNKNGEIDAVDMLLMQRLIMRINPAFPNNNSWRFVQRRFVFDNPTLPFAADFPETLFTPVPARTMTDGDFVAIKVGDLNLSAGTTILRGHISPFVLSVEDKLLEKNKTYQIPIKLMPFQKDYKGQAVSALQFALNIDKSAAVLDNIAKGDLPNCGEANAGLFKNEGIVTAAWARSLNQKFIENDSFTMFNVTIRPTKNVRLSDILSLNPVYTEGVAFDEIGNGAPVKLSFGVAGKASDKAVLLPNRPNPFTDETTLAFIMPEMGNAKLTVYDMMGRVLMQTEKAFNKGLNEVIFDAKATPSVASFLAMTSGVLVVRLQTGGQVMEQKIVLSH